MPKGASFNNLTAKDVKLLQDNIAGLYKDKIKKTPYQQTLELFPDLIKCLNISYISPDEVNLSSSLFRD